MILTKEQTESLSEAAKPLIKWLNENAHPHVIVIVENDGAAILETSATIKNDEFIK